MRSWHPLRRRRDFEQLYREGQRFRSPLLTLVLRAAPSPGVWRAATVCGKQVGGAVTRNRLKRRLRSLLDRVAWPQDAGGDLALICKPPAAAVSFAELASQVQRLLSRAGLEEA